MAPAKSSAASQDAYGSDSPPGPITRRAAFEQTAKKRRTTSSTTTTTLVVAWLAVIISALGIIARYVNTPGRDESAPKVWPAQSSLALDLNRPTLLMFAHPHCPCTRASLGELELLLARCPNQLSVHVLFIRPNSLEPDWVQTDLWRKAHGMPKVKTLRDDGGVEARRFHSTTSGKVLLYDAGGRLLFEGGITSSRGHSGDNAGRSALMALLNKQAIGPVQTPVFGCPLFENSCAKKVIECRN